MAASTAIRRSPSIPTLAAEIQAERDALLTRFLDVGWEIGPDGRAQALRVSGQLPVYDDVEAVFSQDNVAEGDAYAVSGLTSTAAPDQLRAAGDDYPSWVTDRYLELPETITDRTRELASQLAAGQSNAFDTAVAVEEYVRSTITYNEDIDAPPDNQDVVDYVLFESQEGYCEYYASAMAVLLRAEGIPSRVVGGYFPAPYDPNEGGHLYREKNAHLWVEAFFPGYGWIPFEPTANRERLDYGDLTAPAQEPALPTPVPTPPPVVAEPTPPPVAETPAEQPPMTPPDILSDPARLAGWIGLALAALVAVAALAAVTAWFVGFRGLSPVSSLYARALASGQLARRAAQGVADAARVCRSGRSRRAVGAGSRPGRRRALHPGALRRSPAGRGRLARRARRLARSARDRHGLAPAPESGRPEGRDRGSAPRAGTGPRRRRDQYRPGGARRQSSRRRRDGDRLHLRHLRRRQGRQPGHCRGPLRCANGHVRRARRRRFWPPAPRRSRRRRDRHRLRRPQHDRRVRRGAHRRRRGDRSEPDLLRPGRDDDAHSRASPGRRRSRQAPEWC